MQELAKALNKPCMYITLDWFRSDGTTGDPKEILKAAPYLDCDDNDHMQALSDGMAILVFDSEEEMEDHYQQTVGDDGPTEKNPYNGPGRVYALTCTASGELQNENT